MALRRWINDVHGRTMSRRINRAAYNKRTLLIADHWDGSVQQFYHFLLGYLMPIALWLRDHPQQPIAVRDCGPMQPWLDLLGAGNDVEVLPPGTALHMIVGDRMAHQILKGMDDPSTFDRAAINGGTSALHAVLGLPDHADQRATRVVVLDRASSESFYRGSESETHMSGAERRSTPNLALVAEDASLGVDVVDLARMSPAAQVALMQQTRVLVGQHGAGLVHMIWMQPGSAIIEIAPPLPPEVVDLFERLAACLGMRYERIRQADVHADVDLTSVANAIRLAQN